MKIILICLEDEKEKAHRINIFLGKMGIPTETLLFESENGAMNCEAMNCIGKKFSAFFVSTDGKDNIPSHVVVFSAMTAGCVDFLSGFSCGSNIPFLVCGDAATSCVPEMFTFCFKFFKDEEALEVYFNTEYEKHKNMSASGKADKARQALLSMGIPVTAEAMAQCAADDHLDEIALFLAAGFSPDTRNKSGVPLLNIAARSGNGEVVRFLLRSSAQVDLPSDDRGSSALIDGAMGRYFDIIKDLIEAGADPNMRSNAGQTALVVAVGADDEESATVLIKAGANPDIEDNMGVSARKYATLFRKTKMLALFDAQTSGKVVK